MKNWKVVLHYSIHSVQSKTVREHNPTTSMLDSKYSVLRSETLLSLFPNSSIFVLSEYKTFLEKAFVCLCGKLQIVDFGVESSFLDGNPQPMAMKSLLNMQTNFLSSEDDSFPKSTRRPKQTFTYVQLCPTDNLAVVRKCL